MNEKTHRVLRDAAACNVLCANRYRCWGCRRRVGRLTPQASESKTSVAEDRKEVHSQPTGPR